MQQNPPSGHVMWQAISHAQSPHATQACFPMILTFGPYEGSAGKNNLPYFLEKREAMTSTIDTPRIVHTT
jgi:hypothetical protein